MRAADRRRFLKASAATAAWAALPVQTAMKNILRLGTALLAALAASVAPAADGACEASATQKALTGAARTSFLKQCEADAALLVCDTQAVERKLADAARANYINKCLEDTALKNASPACDAQAVEKKLAGSSRTSFMKKCVAEKSGGSPG